MKSLIFILTVIINVQAESHIFHKRNVDLRIEMDGMEIEKRNILNLIKCIGLCNKENKCHFVSYKSSLCVLYSFYAEYYLQYSADTILYEKLNHRNIGLTNYWPIENSQAMDVVGAKDLYEPINCLFSNDRFGTNASALSFNSGFMKAPSGDYLGGKEFTVLAWVKLRSYSSWQRFIDFGNGPYINNILVILSDEDKIFSFRIVISNLYKEVKSSALQLNTWYHLGFTLNQETMSIYIDGNLKNSTQTENTNLGTDDFKEYCFIGKSAFSHDPSGNFECDDIKFFNKALTDVEIETSWGLYQDLLKSASQQNSYTENIYELNEHISKKIIHAAQKKRMKMRKLFQKSRCGSLKVSFNKLTSELRLGLKEFWNQNWLMNKIGKHPLSSIPFWRKINKFRTKKLTRQIPSLLKDGKQYDSGTDKGKNFGDLLATTFSPHLDFVESDDNYSILTFGPMVDEMKERCNSRLNIIKYLSNRKWGLKPKTLDSFSGTNIKKIQVIQNSAVQFILKLKYDTPSNIMHQEAFNKLKLLTVTNRLFELSERYVRAGLNHSVPLVVRLVEEYREGFESRYIESSVQKTNK
ncbi:glycoside hydrolase [Brachionus plicatilis]|uniref:Glycoside hydrolase n=1 Tax=Brachionus plicatilis TaxID=10195 RepID=A0A3M7QQN4_BRAPC|nr:glycoside hydrolase [Brachionus plicatilis]